MNTCSPLMKYLAPQEQDMADRHDTSFEIRDINEDKLEIEFVITSPRRDDFGTRFDPDGMDLSQFRRNPVVLYRHMRDEGIFTLPVARALPERLTIDQSGKVHMIAQFTPEETFEFGFLVYKMVKEGFLNMASIGAQILEQKIIEEANGDQTIVFTQWKLFEFSIVPIGANDDAMVSKRAKEIGMKPDIMKREAKKLYKISNDVLEDDAQRVMDTILKKSIVGEQLGKPKTGERWNRDLPSSFDVSEVDLPPSGVVFDLVSKHIGCEVKQIFHNMVFIPSARIGSFLKALKERMAEYQVDDVRNISGSGGESPPVYEVIQLNSKTSDDFLIDGISFMSIGNRAGKFSVRVYPTWGGMQMDIFTKITKKEFNREFVDTVWRSAVDNNLLRGEAFSLSGEFIKKTNETWDDVFLTEKNKNALRGSAQRLSERGKSCANRGVLLMGKPGTGKTMAGRIVRNTVDATFIWMSAKDFYRGGSVGSLNHAYQLAKELAPCVLFMEDVDNWLDGRTIDFLKTEMDGIARSSGILTMLTTNHPEDLPDAMLDRPGRFHDVLHIDLPDSEARATMVRSWIDGIGDKDIEFLVKETAGYSGAHMYELASFIKNLQESDDIELSEAITQALEKLDEQRKLISKVKKSGVGQSREIGDHKKHREYFEQVQPVVKQYRKLMDKLYKRMGLKKSQDEIEAVTRITELIVSPTALKATLAPEAREPTPEEAKAITAKLAGIVIAKKREALANGVPLSKIERLIPEWTQEAITSLSPSPK